MFSFSFSIFFSFPYPLSSSLSLSFSYRPPHLWRSWRLSLISVLASNGTGKGGEKQREEEEMKKEERKRAMRWKEWRKRKGREDNREFNLFWIICFFLPPIFYSFSLIISIIVSHFFPTLRLVVLFPSCLRIQETDKKHAPLFGPGLTGLVNMGNT